MCRLFSLSACVVINHCEMIARFPFSLSKCIWEGRARGRVYWLCANDDCVAQKDEERAGDGRRVAPPPTRNCENKSTSWLNAFRARKTNNTDRDEEVMGLLELGSWEKQCPRHRHQRTWQIPNETEDSLFSSRRHRICLHWSRSVVGMCVGCGIKHCINWISPNLCPLAVGCSVKFLIAVYPSYPSIPFIINQYQSREGRAGWLARVSWQCRSGKSFIRPRTPRYYKVRVQWMAGAAA